MKDDDVPDRTLDWLDGIVVVLLVIISATVMLNLVAMWGRS